MDDTELTGYIVLKNDEQQIAYAAVLVPGEPDGDFARGEKLLTVAEIERVAHKWMMSYRNVDIQHTLKNVANPVESYLLPAAMNVTVKGKLVSLPKGTWILASKVDAPETWEGIKSGALTGYSVMGVRASSLKNEDGSVNKSATAALKRTLIADLGDDWVAPFVSIVDEPCVPKAKFFALKAAVPDETSTAIEPVEKAGRSFSEDTLTQLRAAYESLKGLITRAEQERVPVETPMPVAEEKAIHLTEAEVLYDNKIPAQEIPVDVLADISFEDYQSVRKADEDNKIDVIGQITLDQFYAVQKGGEGSGIPGHTTDHSSSGSSTNLEKIGARYEIKPNSDVDKDVASRINGYIRMDLKNTNQALVDGKGIEGRIKYHEKQLANNKAEIAVCGRQIENGFRGLDDGGPSMGRSDYREAVAEIKSEYGVAMGLAPFHEAVLAELRVTTSAKKSLEDPVDEDPATDAGVAEALTSVKEIEKMTPEELKTVIDSAVKSALDPVTARLDALDQTVSAKAEKADVTAKEEILTTEIASVKSALDIVKTDIVTAKTEVVDQVTKSIENLAGKPASKAISIADIVTPPTPAGSSDRDEFGRKIRS